MTLLVAIVVNSFITMFCLTVLLMFPGMIFRWHWLYLVLNNIGLVTLLIMGGLAGAAITPVGEKVFRKFSGAREPIRQESDFLEPIFRRVLKQCGFERSQFDLCVIDGLDPNAFALGRRTVAMSKGLMRLPEDEIEAAFAHELGHMKHGDSVRGIIFFMISGVGQLMIIILNRVTAGLCKIPFVCWIALPFNWLTWLISFTLTLPLMFAERHSGRRKEYRADKFAFDNGYGQGIVNFLQRLMVFDGESGGIMAMIQRTHPVSGERIKKIEDMLFGKVDYSKISDEDFERGV